MARASNHAGPQRATLRALPDPRSCDRKARIPKEEIDTVPRDILPEHGRLFVAPSSVARMTVRAILLVAFALLCVRCSSFPSCAENQACVKTSGGDACLATCEPDAGACAAGGSCQDLQPCCASGESCPTLNLSVCCPATGC
jgi:hypothetical protein